MARIALGWLVVGMLGCSGLFGQSQDDAERITCATPICEGCDDAAFEAAWTAQMLEVTHPVTLTEVARIRTLTTPQSKAEALRTLNPDCALAGELLTREASRLTAQIGLLCDLANTCATFDARDARTLKGCAERHLNPDVAFELSRMNLASPAALASSLDGWLQKHGNQACSLLDELRNAQ